MTRLVAVVLGAVVLALSAGCGVGACTAIGCLDQVVVTLAPSEQALFSQPTEVSLCVNGSCTTATIGGSSAANANVEVGGTGLIVRSTLGSVSKGTVHLTLSQQGTQRFDRTWADVTFTETRPNGPLCPPTCHAVTLDATM
ncbi:MAG: hypothetical protein U0228_10975 [Myxococcaceae bacterium]